MKNVAGFRDIVWTAPGGDEVKDKDDWHATSGEDNVAKDFIEIKMFIYRLKTELSVGLENIYLFSSEDVFKWYLVI